MQPLGAREPTSFGDGEVAPAVAEHPRLQGQREQQRRRLVFGAIAAKHGSQPHSVLECLRAVPPRNAVLQAECRVPTGEHGCRREHQRGFWYGCRPASRSSSLLPKSSPYVFQASRASRVSSTSISSTSATSSRTSERSGSTVW